MGYCSRFGQRDGQGCFRPAEEAQASPACAGGSVGREGPERAFAVPHEQVLPEGQALESGGAPS